MRDFTHLLLALTMISSSSSAHLFARQDKDSDSDDNKCADPSFTPCSAPLLPSNFCCPSNTKCIPLNRQTSMICCPAGQDCQFIQPITCDISLQNATAHPRNPVQSTNLSATLPKCGSGCCPLGYDCRDGQCAMDKSTSGVDSLSSSAGGSSSTVTSSPSSTTKVTAGPTMTTPSSSSSTSTATSAAGAVTQPTQSLTPSAANKEFPAKAILAGFFPGFVLGILLTLAIVWFLARRKQKRISAPIYQGDTSATARTDFLRRRTRSKTFSMFSRPGLPSFSKPGSTSNSNSGSGLGMGMGMGAAGAGNSGSSPMMMTRNGSTTTRTPLVRSTSLRSDTASIDLVLAHDDGTGIPPVPGTHQLHVAQAGSSTYSPSQRGPLTATTFNPASSPAGAFVGTRDGPGGARERERGNGAGAGFLSPTYPPPPTIGSSNGKQNNRGISQMTAFTDLMETAGFKKGEPFVVHTERERDPPRHAGAGSGKNSAGRGSSGSGSGSGSGSFGKNSAGRGSSGGASGQGSGGRNRWQQQR